MECNNFTPAEKIIIEISTPGDGDPCSPCLHTLDTVARPPSLIPLLVRYLSNNMMQVKFKGEVSDIFSLVSRGHQGTLLGGIENILQSNDNADIVSQQDRFKYIDDLSVLQQICQAGLLTEDFISHWTNENLMKLNKEN